jgi:peptidyl-prolyl cis-trans isomerase SurA
MKNPILVFCVASLLTNFSSCKVADKNTTKTDETPILTVGKQTVSIDEFRYVYEKNNAQDSIAYSETSLKKYIDLFVNYKLKVLAADELGMDTTADFKAELAHYQQQLAKPYLTDNEASAKLVKESYQRLKEEVRASHILIKASPLATPADTLIAYNKMLEIRKKIIAGEDFGVAAKKYSEDPSAAQNAGDIGYFTALQMVYQFEDVAYKTNINEVSQILRTKFGYHILKVTNRRISSGPVKVAHILIRATEGISKEDSLAAANKIQELYKQLQNGADWNKIAEQYSEDIDTRNRGGELKWFSPGNMYPTFDEAAFALQKKDEISMPVKTMYGWHLIKLLDKKPLETFEQMEPILKRKISKDSRLEINKAFLINKLKKENKFVVSKKATKLILSKADSTILQNTWKYDRKDADLGKVLFSINKEIFTLKDFLDYVETSPAITEKTQASYYIQQKFQDYTNKAIYDYQNEHLSEKVPEYRYLMNEYHDGTLMFKIMEQNVWTKALTDTAGLNRYFEANRANYRWKDRAVATIYICDSEQMLNKLQEELQKDYFENEAAKFSTTEFAFNKIEIDSLQKNNIKNIANFLLADSLALVELQGYVLKNEKTDLANKRMQSIKKYLLELGVPANKIAEKTITKAATKKAGVQYVCYSKSNKILLAKLSKANPLAIQLLEGTIQKGENVFLDKTTWQTGKFVVNHNGQFAYVLISAIIPETNKKLNETKGNVVTDYQNYLETTWLDDLRKKYPVTIHEEVLKKMVQK